MKKLRVGLIGLGSVAEVHLQAYKEVKQVIVVAGADLRKDRLNQMVEKWGIKGYTDYEEMLKKENLDIACVLTPPRSHREVTEKVAEYGVNVLVEKPMALTLEEATSMIVKCKKEAVKLCYGSSYRYLCACVKAKEIIDEGLLGNLFLLMETVIGGQGLKNWQPLSEAHYPIGGPGGGGWGLIDHGIHLADIFRWFTSSEVESVFGRGNYSGQAPSTEYLTMRFKKGIIGQLIYNEATYPSDMPSEGTSNRLWPGWEPYSSSIRVHGEKGALRIFHYANKLFLFRGDRREEVHVLDRTFPSNFALQMESFANSLLECKDPEVTGIDGLKALQVILAAYESFETQKIVKIKPIL
jgi:predicted dehydrogenase